MAVSLSRWAVVCGLGLVAWKAAVATNFAPTSWAIASLALWLSHTTVTGWRRMSTWEQRHLLWGMTSLLAFLHFLLLDPSFQSWEDVFFFCGRRWEYCSCSFRWNSRGWTKSAILWNFTLSTALAAQKLVIGLGLNGLLPGEDLVTKESFISIGWRLIPYYLNNWEQQWGAECSSMIMELPHFALELLVVLPCAQIIAARLKILAQPHVRLPARRPDPAQQPHQQHLQLPAGGPQDGAGALGPGAAGAAAEQQLGQVPGPAGGREGAAAGGVRVGEGVREAPAAVAAAEADGAAAEVPDDGGEGGGALVPDPLRCVWVRDPAQRRLLPRLKANTKMMGVLVLITAVALFNAIVMPLALEGQVRGTARAEQILRLGEELGYTASKGRLAEMARWYEAFIEADIQRAAASSASNRAAGGTREREEGGSLDSSGSGILAFVSAAGTDTGLGTNSSGGGSDSGGAPGLLDRQQQQEQQQQQQEEGRAAEGEPGRQLLEQHSEGATHSTLSGSGGSEGGGEGIVEEGAASEAGAAGWRANAADTPAALLPLLRWAALHASTALGAGPSPAPAAVASTVAPPPPPDAAHVPASADGGEAAAAAATAAAAAAEPVTATLGVRLMANSSAGVGEGMSGGEELAGAAGVAGPEAEAGTEGAAAPGPAAAGLPLAPGSTDLAVSVLAMRVAGGAPWPASENSSQLAAELAGAGVGAAAAADARLAVLCTLWEPLLPLHWLRAMHMGARTGDSTTAAPPLALAPGAGNSSGKGTLLWALQFRPRPTTAALIAATRAAAGAAAWATPAAMQQQEQQQEQQGEEAGGSQGRELLAAGLAPEVWGVDEQDDQEHASALAQLGQLLAALAGQGGEGSSAASRVASSLVPASTHDAPERAEQAAEGAESREAPPAQPDTSKTSSTSSSGSAQSLELARMLLAAVTASDLDLSDPLGLGEGWLALEAAAANATAGTVQQRQGEEGGASAEQQQAQQQQRQQAADLAWLRGRQRQWEERACMKQKALMSPLYRMLNKHAVELRRMADPEHRSLIPLVEASLAVMRLSCENFFSLAAVFAGYLLFRDPPPAARLLIVGVARLSHIFQRAILYAFPAVCWSYGAGFVFSTFVSVVFYGGPLLRALERMRTATTSVMPRAWHPATAEELERMGGQCAICWGDMGPRQGEEAGGGAAEGVGGESAGQERAEGPAALELRQQQQPPEGGLRHLQRHEGVGGQQGERAGWGAGAMPEPAAALGLGLGQGLALEEHQQQQQQAGLGAFGDVGPGVAFEGSGSGVGGSARAMGLPCGHAYHESCLLQWLHQCYGQARQPTCPMCQAAIRLRVSYRMPFASGGQGGGAGGEAEGGLAGEGPGGRGPGAAGEEGGIPGIQALVRALQDDFRNRFEPVLVGAEQEVLGWEGMAVGEDDFLIPANPPPPHHHHHHQQEQQPPQQQAAEAGAAAMPPPHPPQPQQPQQQANGANDRGGAAAPPAAPTNSRQLLCHQLRLQEEREGVEQWGDAASPSQGGGAGPSSSSGGSGAVAAGAVGALEEEEGLTGQEPRAEGEQEEREGGGAARGPGLIRRLLTRRRPPG